MSDEPESRSNSTPVNMGSNNEYIDVDSPSGENASSIPIDDDDDEPKRKLTSVVWNHFKRQKIDGKWKAICNYCNKKLVGETSQGTTHLRDHWKKSCKLRTNTDIRQSLIKMDASSGGEKTVTGTYSFNQEAARQALAKMIILHEYPISIVDHVGFKEFCSVLQPLFNLVSRNTMKSDILKIYEAEKGRTMSLLAKNKSRIAITSDMWTASHQNKGYMAITAHYIDDYWRLQSRLVRFVYVPAPHTAEVLADVLVNCLMDWNIDG